MDNHALNGIQAGDAANVSERALLQSVVEVARIVFGAAAASIFLLDKETGELVFEAVSGDGEERLVGTRFPGGTGIAGWVISCGQSMLVDDLADSAQFARNAAESTGFVPRSIMAAPLIREGDCIGVLEVLDRGSRARDDLSDVDLMGLLATEATLGLGLLTNLRWARAGTADHAEVPGHDLLQRVALRLPGADVPVANTVMRLLATADDLLAPVQSSQG